MTWLPTESFLKGKIIKPFLPFDKHPDYTNPNIRNLYPGDEVYIFETKDEKWARGYVLSKPFPRDFTTTSVNLDDLPTPQIKILVFPLKYVKIVESVAFTDKKNEIEQNELFEGEHLLLNGFSKDSVKKIIPQLPVSVESKRTLEDEIKNALETLNSHIFALYSIGEFRLFNSLVDIFYKLHEVRIKLIHDLLTANEARNAREVATQLLDRIPKKLASKAERLNESSYDLDNDNTDISGYKAILARDAFTGEILTLDSSYPSRIAFNSELCSLVGTFPIHAHNHKQKFTLKTVGNKKFNIEPPSNILVDFKSVSGSSAYLPPGFAGMTAYMYLRNNKKRLTEAFAVHADSVQELANVEKLSAALFRNIPHHEIADTRIYLVAVLTEELDMKIIHGGREFTKRVKRGVAAGATDITRVFSLSQGGLTTGESYHFQIKLFGSFMPYNKTFTSREEGIDRVVNNGWGELPDRIIGGTSNGVAVNPRAEKLIITVKEFRHQFETGLNSSQAVSQTPISRIKAIFFDPLADNYERIYLKMGKISLANGGTKDDLLTVEVSVPNNELITFAKASNQQGKRQWQFISVNPGESIGDIIRINGIALKSPTTSNVPKDDYILLSLYINGVYSGEGKVVYKSGNRLVEFNKKKGHRVEILSCNTGSPIAFCELSTEYVGKFYNSHQSIDNIFQYEKLFKSGTKGTEELASSLKEFCNLDVSQLIKFFPELMLSLYGIIEASQPNESQLINTVRDRSFLAIIHLLDVLFGKSDEYLLLVDNFCSLYKSQSKASVFLLNKMAEIFKQAETTWDMTSRAVCRVISIFMRLSINSMSNATNFQEYFMALNNLFSNVAKFLSIDSHVLGHDQALIMNITDYVLAFRTNLDEYKVLQLIVNFINSIGVKGLGAKEQNLEDTAPGQSVKDHEIIISKLLLILRLINSNLVEKPETRYLLLSSSIIWAMQILTGSTDVEASRLACSILNAVCTVISEQILPIPQSEKDLAICYSLVKFLPALGSSFVKYNKFTRTNDFFKHNRTFTFLFPTDYPFYEFSIDSIVNDEVMVEVLVEMATVFTFIARIGKQVTGDEGYVRILDNEYEGEFFDSDLYLLDNFESEDILSILSGIRWMRTGGYFPQEKWLSLYAVLIEGCTCALELVRPLLMKHIPPADNVDDFDLVLWGNYLRNLLKLPVLAPVAVEYLSDIPRYACFSITGNARDRIAVILKEAWAALGWESSNAEYSKFGLRNFAGYQVEFIDSVYGIIPDLMLFALQKNEACQKVAVDILYSLIAAEYVLSDNIDEIQKQCLVGLNEIYHRHSYKPSTVEQKEFIQLMKSTVSLDPLDPACDVIYRFIDDIADFFVALNYLISVPVGPEFGDDRALHEINILSYLKPFKSEYFTAFVNNLYEVNSANRDYVQSAFCLELLASVYEWNHHQILPASFKPKFPEQTAFQRKEALFNSIATNFIKGKSLARAIDTFNELLDMYRKHTYDLKSFAFVHSKLAKLYLDLESSDNLTPSYFRVEAIGVGFPLYMRGSEQIYQGLPFEHITSIHKRLLNIFPGAKIISSEAEAKQIKSKFQNGRFLYVTVVEPVEEITDKLFNTSIGVRQYARNKDLRWFTITKRLPGSTSISDLWTEETTYETELSFPTLMNRSKIKSSTVVKLSPLDNALKTIVNKNNDLVHLESSINMAMKDKLDHSSLMQDLSRTLAGTVDSPVNGGVGQYRVFFTDSTYEQNADDLEKIQLLRSAFTDLVMILNRCLNLHGKLILPSMLMTHNALVELFKKNFCDEIESLSLIQDPQLSQNYAKSSRYSVFGDRKSSSMLDVASELAQSSSTSTLNHKASVRSNKGSTSASSIYGVGGDSIQSSPTIKSKTAETIERSRSSSISLSGNDKDTARKPRISSGAILTEVASNFSGGSRKKSVGNHARTAKRWRHGDQEF
ncbi:DCK1 [[Candida] subhashii]|uniref:DCK1 n=1 Tax=[Candida] subhashii TaxID=561895 RepID=A0A8J5UKC7_9ASCO|nr:DCK1 [[Candida] subhashii]KAG7665373.1 DCK1 [[Candida] subhashii]